MGLADWNYRPLLPVAVALLALIATWRPFLAKRGALRALVTASGLWFLAALGVLGPLYLDRWRLGAPLIWQRDAGSILGGSVALAVPFAIVLCVLVLLSRRSTPLVYVLALASAVAALTLLILPPLYLVGYFAGCLLVGYRPCI
jgi:hypothetical protein